MTMTVAAGLITTPVAEFVLEFSQVKEPETAEERRISVSFYELSIYQSTEGVRQQR